MSAAAAWRRAARWPALLLIRFYQRVISPWTPPSCRYYPSCSQYAYVAVERHGLVRGGWLAVRRLGRCHPWAAGGVDHVPPAREPRSGATDHPVHGAVHTDVHSDVHSLVPSVDVAPENGSDRSAGPAARPLSPPSDPITARGA
jgi:putative membrane protein insertion efficiency factor